MTDDVAAAAKASRPETVLETVLRIVLARITDTSAAGWTAPNPRASEKAAAAQYDGTLAEFIRATLDAGAADD